MSPFDFIKLLTSNKKPWNELSETERKEFQPFMIHRIFSMHNELVEIVNEIQKYYTFLPSEIYYKFYLDFLPKNLPYKKYIAKNKSKKYNLNLIQFIANHFKISEKDSMDYINVYLSSNKTKNELIELFQAYGMNEKQIKQILK